MTNVTGGISTVLSDQIHTRWHGGGAEVLRSSDQAQLKQHASIVWILLGTERVCLMMLFTNSELVVEGSEH